MIFVIFIALNLAGSAIFQQMSIKGQLLLIETVCICTTFLKCGLINMHEAKFHTHKWFHIF